MLVISRKRNEFVDLVTAEDIPAGTVLSVMVIDIYGNDKARLGFDCPASFRIFRRELGVPLTTEAAQAHKRGA